MEVKYIGAFESAEKANIAIKMISNKDGFANYPDGFAIETFVLGEILWSDGFIAPEDAEQVAKSGSRWD